MTAWTLQVVFPFTSEKMLTSASQFSVLQFVTLHEDIKARVHVILVSTSAEAASGLVGGGSEVISPSGEVISPLGDVISPSGDVISPSGEVISPSGEVIALSGDVIALSGDVISPSGDVISPSGDVISPSEEVIAVALDKSKHLTSRSPPASKQNGSPGLPM